MQVGDTIQCRDMEDMLRVSHELTKVGIFTDWLDIKKSGHDRYKLTVVGLEVDEPCKDK